MNEAMQRDELTMKKNHGLALVFIGRLDHASLFALEIRA